MFTRVTRCVLASCLLALPISLLPAADLRVDFSRTNGVLRALHGGNNGPLGYGELVNLTAFHRELAIPITRLHDSAWPYPDIVDIHAIFRDFNADPARPESYRFGPTDDYLRAITNTGARIVYRLGESIEHAKRKRYVHPPPDAARWTDICLGIIRHFNEGWADGQHLGIRYWEIWNEPENRPAMWTGTDTEFYQLYSTASKTIKARWPELKVGGPALGHLGEFQEDTLQPSNFLRGFMDRIKADRAPLDFFSWHTYTTNASVLVTRARAVRQFLNSEGFRATESHLNEWNYLPDHDWAPMLSASGQTRERWYARQGGAEGAAFAAATLIELQDAPLDMANYYSADNQPFGLFTLHGTPKKTFYAFKAFSALLDSPIRVELTGTLPGRLSASASVSANRREAMFLVSDTGTMAGDHSISGENWPWPGGAEAEVFILDARRNLDRVRTERLAEHSWRLRFQAQPPAVAWIRVRPAP